MKKSLVLVLAFMMVLGVAAMAFADNVSVKITPESAANDRIEVELGDTVTLTATATLGSGNFTFVDDSWTNADRQTGPTAGDTAGDQFVSTAQFNADGYSIGDEITVTYWIKIARGTVDQSPYFEDEDDAYIEVIDVIEEEITIVIKPMAAPAVAAQILKFNEVQPRYGNPRNGGNFIADVAHEMGPQTMFNDVSKEVWCDDADGYVSNPEYWAEVLAFLNDHYRMVVTLNCAYDWFVNNLE